MATTETKISTQSKKYLAEVGKILKSEEDLEREEFYKEWNDPTNLTVEEARKLSLAHIDTLKWEM